MKYDTRSRAGTGAPSMRACARSVVMSFLGSSIRAAARLSKYPAISWMALIWVSATERPFWNSGSAAPITALVQSKILCQSSSGMPSISAMIQIGSRARDLDDEVDARRLVAGGHAVEDLVGDAVDALAEREQRPGRGSAG